MRILVTDLTRGGVSAAVREQGPLDGAAALIHILAGPPSADDEQLLGEAVRRRLPVVAVVPSAADVPGHLPYVLDENVVRVGGGAGFPLERIGQRLARALGESATPLAARLPVLRGAVCEELIRRFSRRNGVIGVVVFVPGADLPILTLNQVRLVLRIADAYGFEIDRERIPEVVAVIGSAFGFRALARKAIGRGPARRLGGEGRLCLHGDPRDRRGSGAVLREPRARDSGRRRARAFPLGGDVARRELRRPVADRPTFRQALPVRPTGLLASRRSATGGSPRWSTSARRRSCS